VKKKIIEVALPLDAINKASAHEKPEHRYPGRLGYYIRRPFRREPDFGVTSVNYDLADLILRAADPQ
jgi:hypothetical protein